MATIKTRVFKDGAKSLIKKLRSDVSPEHSAFKFVDQCLVLLDGFGKQKKKDQMDVAVKLNKLIDKISDKADLPKLKKQIIDAEKSRRYALPKKKITLTKEVAALLQSSVATYLNKRRVSYQVAVTTLLDLAADKLTAADEKDKIRKAFSKVHVVKKLPERVKSEVTVAPPGTLDKMVMDVIKGQ
ncbi:hypothetical protein [Rheinheimera sp. F8]|uniref:hypothetical protein n=1 Tax=Rheinheimera sp. F8 TaxID=1763998 RepID=UPI0007449CBA|nr:hypothetical protein [Rheinheimera sp. F8]ALZ75374.1 hypothetical protein ATY27_06150 [Rheinheimera sp. F8]ALZ75812.1 hypothetical protein ATY27_08555 [Rheinheimera sp. F8]